jgi:hypothetical protein
LSDRFQIGGAINDEAAVRSGDPDVPEREFVITIEKLDKNRSDNISAVLKATKEQPSKQKLGQSECRQILVVSSYSLFALDYAFVRLHNVNSKDSYG